MSSNPFQDNPYQSPAPVNSGPGPYPPPGNQVPVAGMVFGILHLLFGITGICGLAFSAIMFFIPLDPEMTRQNPALQLLAENFAYKLFMQASVLAGFVFSFVLIAAGVGLFQLKSYGRTLSIAYGWYGIVITVLTLIVNVAVVFPALIEKVNNAPPGPEQFGAIGGVAGGVMGILIGPIYPALVLFFMYRPKMIAAYCNR